ncbi:MAG: RHS repeat domain-containing protein [Pyrinomonadaceae bacterium]
MTGTIRIRIAEIALGILFVSISSTTGLSQGEVKNTSGSADKSLKSAARVNPATLAMEFSVPLASYPGRAGNSVPLALNYSSKVWQIQPFGNWSMPQYPGSANRIYYTDARAKFGERSSAGWTSSFVPPRLEIKEEYFDEEGKPWSFVDALLFHSAIYQDLMNPTSLMLPTGCREIGRETQCGSTPPPSNVYFCWINIYIDCGRSGPTTFDQPDPPSGGGGGLPQPHEIGYVKRARVYMPDGSSHEFRQDDAVHPYCTTAPNSSLCNGTPNTYEKAGTYFSVDGSRMKLGVGESGQPSFLYLPDGSRYIFGIEGNWGRDQYATEFIDVNGNRTLYTQSVVQDPTVEEGKLQGAVVDNLERPGLIDPLAQNKDVRLKVGEQTYHAPGFDGTTQDYTLKWAKLEDVRDDPASQPLSYRGSHVCFIGGQNTMKTHHDGPQYDDPNVPDDDDGPILFYGGSGTRVCSSAGGSPDRIFNPVLLAEIVLPNGKSYRFRYNQFGEITTITHPTGAYEQFEYGKLAPIGNEPSPHYDQANRGVKRHRVYQADGTLETDRVYEESVNNGQYPVPPNAPYKITTTNRDGSKIVAFLHRTDNEAFGFSDPRSGMAYDEQVFDTNGVLRARTLTDWRSSGPLSGGAAEASRDARPQRRISIIIDGGQAIAQMSETEFEDPSTPGSGAPTDPSYFAHLNAIRTKAYDYRVIDLSLAQTGGFDQISTYFAGATPVSINETEHLYGAVGEAYRNRGILGLVRSTSVLDPGTGQPIAKTEYRYDEQGQYFSMVNVGSTVGYQAPTGTNSELRGNVTTLRIWNKDTDNWVETHTQYDNFGNARKAWDASGDQSKFVETEFGASYMYAYPTKVITPAPDPTGTHGTNQGSFTTSTYDFMTGLPRSVTDEFGQTTATEYNDPLLRPTRVYGVGSYVIPVTETIYDDTARTVKVRKQIDAANWDEATTFYDSLGRTIKTQSKDSQGDVIVETKYDFLGRAHMVSNPYRQGDSAVLWSLTEYDELGRVKQTREPVANQNPSTPTGNILGTTAYDISTAPGFIGTVVTTADAAGKKGRSITNALGQLIRVDEPDHTGGLAPLPQSTPQPTPTPSGTPPIDPPPGCSAECLTNTEYPSYSTVYRYDALGKMVEVIQGVQHRFFKYDSLGRLIRVRQPEQEVNSSLNLADAATGNSEWTAGFAYDVLGNVLRATDANGVNIINEYDRAGRVTKRCYTKPNVATSATTCAQIPTGDQSVDTPAVNFWYDGKGLAQQQSPNFAKGKLTKVDNTISATEYLTFDNFGRVTRSRQITDGIVYGTDQNPITYTYNLSGALIEETYPSGRKVKSEFESDGDLAKVESQRNASDVLRPYVSNFSYTASGGISQMRLGNGRWETAKFNTRLQVTELGLGASASDAGLWKVNYEYGELDASGNVVASKNAGNIARQTLTVPGASFVQSYRYDSLYRLTEAVEKTGSTQNWVQNWSYDRYGNRLSFSQNITGTSTNSTPGISEQTNRFTDLQTFGYDKNGNLISDRDKGNLPRQFSFNGDNKQSKVIRAGKLVAEYFYDGEGKRIKKKVYNPDNPAVVDEEIVFVYSSGKLIAEYSTKPVTDPKINYTTTDHLGSPRIVTDQNGQVTSRRDFMPFGEELLPNVGSRANVSGYTAIDNVRQKFTGYQKDEETQLDFAEARMYESRHGRMSAVDPVASSMIWTKPQSLNRYLYCLNNPLSYIDKSGGFPTEIHNQLIKDAFPGLNDAQIRMIQYGSALVDTTFGTGNFVQIWNDGSNPFIGSPWSRMSVGPVLFDFPRTLLPSEAYKHAMTPPGKSKEEAVVMADDFISSNINDAIKLQNSFDSSGTFISHAALVSFGKAAHTMMDAFSPTHRFFQPYSIPRTNAISGYFTAKVGDVNYSESDWVKFIGDGLAHKRGESSITSAERAGAIRLLRINLLTGLGKTIFEQAVTDPSQRQAIYAAVDSSRYTTSVPSSFSISRPFSVPTGEWMFERPQLTFRTNFFRAN